MAISAAVGVALLAGCGSSQSTGATANGSSVVTVAGSGLDQAITNFNPFSPNFPADAVGLIYEPLFFFDTADASKVSPWLGQAYKWSNAGKTLTFTLRHGVKWTDGTPFTSKDVAFTFNLEKSNKALNEYGLPYKSITTKGDYTVIVNFTRPAYSDIYYIAGSTYILPQHIWSKVKNPATYLNRKPVGTGAFTVTKATPSVLDLAANPHYYQPGLPHIKKVQFQNFESNTGADLAVETGQVDMGGLYIPNIKKNYLDKNKAFSVSDFPLSFAVLIPNMHSGPTAKLAVREAISDAINRPFVSKSVYQGYALPANPEALLLPSFKDVLDPALKGASFTYSASKARSTLQAAGIKLPLKIDAQVVSSFTDYLQILQIIQPELKQAGIDLSISAESGSAFTDNQDSGKFQLLMDYSATATTPYLYYESEFNGSSTPPIGQTDAAGNYGRYNNPEVNAALAKIAGTNSLSVQRPYFYKIEKIVAKQLPNITLFDQQNEEEIDTARVAGYPTQANPYANSKANLNWLLLHMTAK